MRSPCRFNVISVVLGKFLLPASRAELEPRRDDEKWSLLPLTKSHCELLRHLWFPSFLGVLLSLQVFPAFQWILGTLLSSNQFCCSISEWECKKVHHFRRYHVLNIEPFGRGRLTRENFAAPQCPVQNPPRTMHIRGRLLAKLSCQTNDTLTGLVQKSDIVSNSSRSATSTSPFQILPA